MSRFSVHVAVKVAVSFAALLTSVDGQLATPKYLHLQGVFI